MPDSQNTTRRKYPPFWGERTDIPEPKREKGGMGVLVAAVGMLACVVGAIGWTLWSAL